MGSLLIPYLEAEIYEIYEDFALQDRNRDRAPRDVITEYKNIILELLRDRGVQQNVIFDVQSIRANSFINRGLATVLSSHIGRNEIASILNDLKDRLKEPEDINMTGGKRKRGRPCKCKQGGGAGSSTQRKKEAELDYARRQTIQRNEQTRQRNEDMYRQRMYDVVDGDITPILSDIVTKGGKYIQNLKVSQDVSFNLASKYIFDELKKYFDGEKLDTVKKVVQDSEADPVNKIRLLKMSLVSLLLEGKTREYQNVIKHFKQMANKATAVDYGQTPQEDTEIEGGGAGSSKSKKKKKESKYEVPEQAPPSRPTQAFTGDSTENADFLRSLLQPMREDQSQSRPRGRPRRQQPQQESSPPPQPPRQRGRPRSRTTLETIIETPRTPRLDIIQRQPIVEEPDTPRQQRPQYRPLSNLEVSEYINYSFDRLRDYYLTLPNTSLAQFNGIIYASILSVRPNRVSEIENTVLGKTPEEAYTILKKVLSNLQDFTTTEGAGSSILQQISQYVSRASTREGMGRKRGRPRKVSVPIPPKKQRGRPRKSI